MKTRINDSKIIPLPTGEADIVRSCVLQKGHKVLQTSKRRGEGANRNAFTLAEVLITLGVIGVVAAVTLPTLVQNYKKHVVETKVKKTYTLISNAIRMSEAKYGEMSEWDTCEEGSSYECSKQIFEKYISPTLSIGKICEENNKEDCWSNTVSLSNSKRIALPLTRNTVVTAVLNNGIAFYMWGGGQLTNPHIQIWFDIDGAKRGKNMLGVDVFGIKITYNSDTEKSGVWMRGLSTKNVDENDIRNNPELGCSKDIESVYAGYNCGGLIQLNNWKIPDDYPVKF